MILIAACAFAAGSAVAQTAAPAAKPATVAATAPAAKPKPHREAQPGSGPRNGLGHPPSFDDLDTNHDGVVSKAEFDAWHTAHPGRPGEGPHGGPDGPGGRGGWGGPGGRGDFELRHDMMLMHMMEMERHGHGGGRFGKPFDLEAADTDHDGKISWAEFQAAAGAKLKEHFDRLDANHDGFIDKDELPGHGKHGHHDGKAHGDGKDAAPAK